jgi:sigma-54 dependent transcriptional regulator, acetoin dehydrogenase operon transcriptional activator AcoR
MKHAPADTAPDLAQLRLQQIARAREAVMREGRTLDDAPADGWFERTWIERSWRRCLANGQRPEDRVAFDMVPAAAARRALDENHVLLQAAQPVLDRLCRAIANTRYFAILTDAQGVVIGVDGDIDHADRRAHMIARVGVDLSERSVGTTAISAALGERMPVWLHRGEHFFADTEVYSCAGAPLFGPDGRCVGMLDLTGIEAAERPELKHLVAQSARSIENALTLARPHALLVRLNWPGRQLGDETDGLVCLDADGWVTGANQTARQMVPQLGQADAAPAHTCELFALAHEMLVDASRRARYASLEPLEIPLWSGLRLHGLALRANTEAIAPRRRAAPAMESRSLKDVEIALIHKAVDDARGNVMLAAQALGISRATVYRKLGRKPGKQTL